MSFRAWAKQLQDILDQPADGTTAEGKAVIEGLTKGRTELCNGKRTWRQVLVVCLLNDALQKRERAIERITENDVEVLPTEAARDTSSDVPVPLVPSTAEDWAKAHSGNGKGRAH